MHSRQQEQFGIVRRFVAAVTLSLTGATRKGLTHVGKHVNATVDVIEWTHSATRLLKVHVVFIASAVVRLVR